MRDKKSRLKEIDRTPEWQDEEDDEEQGSRIRFYLVPVVVLILIMAIVFIVQSSQPESGAVTPISSYGPVTGTAPKVGAPASDFTLVSLDGKPVSLSSFKGKVVLLNFFATWCPPCRAEMPDLQSTYAELKDRGFEIVAVDLQEDRNTVSGYAKSLGLEFTILLDRDASVFGQYRVNGLPTTYFIDRDGVVKEFVIGGMNKKTIREKLDQIL